MLDNDLLTAEEIARKAMHIAGDLCVYTNHNTIMETLNKDSDSKLLLSGESSTAVTHLLAYCG